SYRRPRPTPPADASAGGRTEPSGWKRHLVSADTCRMTTDGLPLVETLGFEERSVGLRLARGLIHAVRRIGAASSVMPAAKGCPLVPNVEVTGQLVAREAHQMMAHHDALRERLVRSEEVRASGARSAGARQARFFFAARRARPGSFASLPDSSSLRSSRSIS